MTTGPLGVVVNPVHRSATRAADAVCAYAVAHGLGHPVLRHTTVRDPGGPQARELLAAGCASVVGIGGDGTLREVALAVAGTGTPLGVVATGTANLFARNLGLPRRPADQVATAVAGPVRAVDLGLARLDGGAGQPFLAYAGIGQDAATVADTRPGWKRRLGPFGWLAYVAAGAPHLLAGAVAVDVRVDDGPVRRVAAWCVLVGNAGALPAGIRVFPAARLDDGELAVLEVAGDPARWPLVAAEGVLHRRVRGSGLRRMTAHRVAVASARPLPVQLDGDAVGAASRAEFRVLPHALRVRTVAWGPCPA